MSKGLFIILSLFCLVSCDFESIFSGTNKAKYKLIEEGSKPFSFRVYELQNGLKVYLSKNERLDRIQTNIGVKVGSKNDPSYNTGIANYVEKMMYNGTSKIGSDNWEKESIILQEITDLFEKRRQESSVEKKDLIFNQIDSLSILASDYSIANEYTKLIELIGGLSTSSYTGLDETVFTTNIPSNELLKWAKIESERFSKLTNRNFNLVFEQIINDYNNDLNSDDKLLFNTLKEKAFSNHPYGNQTIIGNINHITNPSVKSIFDFFNKYYIANNMIISLSGNLDYENTMDIIASEFLKLQKGSDINQDLNSHDNKKQSVSWVKGNRNNEVLIGYKLNGLNIENLTTLNILDRMFINGYNGQLENNLISNHYLEDAFSYPWINKESSMLIIGGFSRENQALNQVEDLLLSEVEKIKNGDFNKTLPQACLNDLKKDFLVNVKSNFFRGNELLYSGLFYENTKGYLNRFLDKKMANKSDIMQFANANFDQNYTVVKLEKGGQTKVNIKPIITSPIKLRKGYFSNFYKGIKNEKALSLTSQNIDLDDLFKTEKNNNLFYLENKENGLFNFNMVFDFGEFDEPNTVLALEYLKMLGTNTKTRKEVNSSLFENGGSWKVLSNTSSITIQIEGLDEYFEETVLEVMDLFKNFNPNYSSFKTLINQKQKHRKDLNYQTSYLLWEALLGKIQFGDNNPYISPLTGNKLGKLKINDISTALKTILSKPHHLFYYGSLKKKDVKNLIKTKFEFPLWNLDNNKTRLVQNSLKKEVYFVHHDMKQTELLFVGDKGKLNKNDLAFNALFNAYFNLLSFEEIRESQGLAFSTYMAIKEADTKTESDYVYGYLGCQNDKLPLALLSMKKLLKTTPVDEILFKKIKAEVLEKAEKSNVSRESLYWQWRDLNRKGLSSDQKKETLRKLRNFSFQDFVTTFDREIKNLNFSLLIIGNKNEINFEDLKPYGPFKEYKKHEILP